MGANRPSYRPSIEANQKATERDSIFFNLAPDTTVRVRVVPQTDEYGSIFTIAKNHFNLKDENNNGIALACLEAHGNELTGDDCWLCRAQKWLRNHGDKTEKAVAEKLYANPRWNLQVMVFDKASGEYHGPKLLAVSRTTAEKFNALLQAALEVEDDFFMDPDNGQDVVISRIGSGMKTKYEVNLTGKKMPMDTVLPEWESKLIGDVTAALELRVMDVDGQKAALKRTFSDELDWSELLESVG